MKDKGAKAFYILFSFVGLIIYHIFYSPYEKDFYAYSLPHLVHFDSIKENINKVDYRGPSQITLKDLKIKLTLTENHCLACSLQAKKNLKNLLGLDLDVDGLITPSSLDKPWFFYFKFFKVGYLDLRNAYFELYKIKLKEELNINLRRSKKHKQKNFTILGISNVYINPEHNVLLFDIVYSHNQNVFQDSSIQTEKDEIYIENVTIKFGREGILLCSFLCKNEHFEDIRDNFYTIISNIEFEANYRYIDYSFIFDEQDLFNISTIILGRKVINNKSFFSYSKYTFAFLRKVLKFINDYILVKLPLILLSVIVTILLIAFIIKIIEVFKTSKK